MGAIPRSLGDAEQRLAETVRVYSAVVKAGKTDSSPRKHLEHNDEQKEHDGQNGMVAQSQEVKLYL